MATIKRTENGQVVEARDVYGSYYYLADDFGTPAHGAFSDREMAEEALDAEDSSTFEPDLNMDDEGYRLVTCAYCNMPVRPGDSVPKADDDAWEDIATNAGHADDCEWVRTRAHRRD
jgi:hypothetical protein